MADNKENKVTVKMTDTYIGGDSVLRGKGGEFEVSHKIANEIVMAGFGEVTEGSIKETPVDYQASLEYEADPAFMANIKTTESKDSKDQITHTSLPDDFPEVTALKDAGYDTFESISKLSEDEVKDIVGSKTKANKVGVAVGKNK